MTKNPKKKKLSPKFINKYLKKSKEKRKKKTFIARKAKKKGEREELDETHVQVHMSIFVN